MPIIKYHRYTEADADKVREILGVAKRKRATVFHKTKPTKAQIRRIATTLDIYEDDAEKLALAILRGIPGFFYSRRPKDPFDPDSDPPEISINPIGDKLPRIIGGAAAHEMGHQEMANSSLKGGVPAIYLDNFLISELVAAYYSRAKSRDESVFRNTIAYLKKRYNEARTKDPEGFRGVSFDDLRTKAALMVMKDMGVDPGPPPKTRQRSRAIDKTGKKSRGRGSLPLSLGGIN